MTGANAARRIRASKEAMECRLESIVEIAREHEPCTVRQIFYRAVVAGVDGITKDRNGYEKVQRACLDLRRAGRLPWRWIVDTSRTFYMVDQWSDAETYLYEVASLYRRDLWRDAPVAVEVWCESESIASTIGLITTRWRLGLYPIRGQCSESYAYRAATSWRDGRPRAILYVGDHDPAGLDIERSLIEKLERFDTYKAFHDFRRIGVTWAQVEELGLPGTPPKITSESQRKRYPWPESVEAEALPPQLLRDLLDAAISEYVDEDRLEILRTVEEEERDLLAHLATKAVIESAPYLPGIDDHA